MKHKKIIGIFVVVLSLFAIGTNATSVIGVSGPQKTVEMLSDTVSKQSFTLTRQSDQGDMFYTVSVIEDDNEIISLINGTQFKIPDGQNNADYIFEVDSNGLVLGEYDAKIIFTLVNDSKKTANVNITHALSTIVNLNVVKNVHIEPEMVDLSNEQKYDIELEEFSLYKQKFDSTEQIKGIFIIKNNSIYTIRNIPFSFEILNNSKDKIYNINKTELSHIKPGESEEFIFTVVSPNTREKYKLMLHVGGLSKSVDFEIYDLRLILYSSGMVGALVGGILFIIFNYKKLKRS